MNFITKIKIKNFFSIKNEVCIDFKASDYNIENNKNRLFDVNGEYYYNKVVSFYGANASGKTTFLKSIIVLSAVINNESTDKFPTSFKNKFARSNSKSELEITFILNVDNESKEFLYKLTFKSEGYKNIGIEHEEFYRLNNNQKQNLFHRKHKKIEKVAENIHKSVFDKLSEKKSLFQEFGKFETTGTLDKVKEFFKNLSMSSNIRSAYRTEFALSGNDTIKIAFYLGKDNNKEKLKNFLLSFLNSVGLDISKLDTKFGEESEKRIELLGIEIFHEIKKNVSLEFELESDGTMILIKVLVDIFLAKLNNSVLVIDELDSIIHPMLVPIIINLLIENGIQIIYSTHNIYNMKFLQIDEIFLIEKDNKHKTTVQAIGDIENIKGYENLLSLYENGYLGGLPKVKNIITEIL
ncbi:ATP-binding protein [Candidatus Woesearchaeota archaeon]|nr:ATP-binding protein [Candidatus Woesearchaeota archaeon]